MVKHGGEEVPKDQVEKTLLHSFNRANAEASGETSQNRWRTDSGKLTEFTASYLHNTSLSADIRLNFFKLRRNLWPVRANLAKYGWISDGLCQHHNCNGAHETTAHLLNICPAFKHIRTRRHHDVAWALAEALIENIPEKERPAWDVFFDSRLPLDLSETNLRPDIVLVKDVLWADKVIQATGMTPMQCRTLNVNLYNQIRGQETLPPCDEIRIVELALHA